MTLLLVFLLGLLGILIATRKYNDRKRDLIETFQSSSSQPIKKDSEAYIKDLIKNHKASKCTFQQTFGTSSIKGTIYIDGEQIRSDITAPDKQNQEKISHTIIKGENMYVWYEGDAIGMSLNKARVNEYSQAIEKARDPNYVDTELSPETSLLTNMVGLNQYDASDIDCNEWESDEFMFITPPRVNFVDATEFYLRTSAEVCKKCDDEATEASRLLCRKALQCL